MKLSRMEPFSFNSLEVSFDLEKKRWSVQFHPRLYALNYIPARRGFPRVDRKGNCPVGWSHGKTCSKNDKLVCCKTSWIAMFSLQQNRSLHWRRVLAPSRESLTQYPLPVGANPVPGGRPSLALVLFISHSVLGRILAGFHKTVIEL